jgi:hypothetical protein
LNRCGPEWTDRESRLRLTIRFCTVPDRSGWQTYPIWADFPWRRQAATGSGPGGWGR